MLMSLKLLALISRTTKSFQIESRQLIGFIKSNQSDSRTQVKYELPKFEKKIEIFFEKKKKKFIPGAVGPFKFSH